VNDEREPALAARVPYRTSPCAALEAELIDPQTGERYDHLDPFSWRWREEADVAEFMSPLQRILKQCQQLAEWDQDAAERELMVK